LLITNALFREYFTFSLTFLVRNLGTEEKRENSSNSKDYILLKIPEIQENLKNQDIVFFPFCTSS
jgi:hypothetical protein